MLSIPTQAPTDDIQFQSFSSGDLAYWAKYRITQALLQRYRVKSVLTYRAQSRDDKYFTIKSHEGKPIFAYPTGEDGYKLYSPTASKFRFRYWGHKPKNFAFGLAELPQSGPIVLLTGGEKDVLSLTYLGYPAIALNSETTLPSAKLLAALNDRFQYIAVLYDQDDTGRKMSQRLRTEFGLVSLTLPPMHPPHKDISDYIAYDYPIKPLLEMLRSAKPAPPPSPQCLPLQSLLHRFDQEPIQTKVFRGIPPVSMGYVVGPPKSGKTTFCEGLAFSLAAGADAYLEEPLCLHNRKVMFFSLEEYWQNRLARNQ
ncbi:MAG: toprim domain-containing protein, partial [Bacteroidota bacterium]